jgi:hypothetical protein
MAGTNHRWQESKPTTQTHLANTLDTLPHNRKPADQPRYRDGVIKGTNYAIDFLSHTRVDERSEYGC